jgi:3-oxoacyl-[acyl-carrier protein] reductase
MARISKNIIITGASQGIGKAIASTLAGSTHNILVNYNSNRAAADAVVQAIKSRGFQAVAFQANVADSGDISRMFDKVEALWGGVDVLINNAGIMKLSSLSNMSDNDFSALVHTNLAGAFYGMREAANRMRDSGSIINLSTSVVGLNLPNYGIYAATKAAVETMTRILAKELGAKKIRVNAVAPGPTVTDLFMEGKSDELLQKLTSMIPLSRLGKPEDIAKIVAFLVSDEGSWVNGQVIRANGGMI